MNEMANNPNVSYFAAANNRGGYKPFGIGQPDRLQHMYVVGKTGVGKSTLLKTLAMQDIIHGRGCAIIDPHGDLAESIFRVTPLHFAHRVIYLNAPENSCSYGYNPLRRVKDDHIALAASGLMETLEKLWPSAWGVRIEHVLRNTLYALLERDGSTLLDVLRLYGDALFRAEVVRAVRNPVVREFWRVEFDPLTVRQQAELVAPIRNKLGALLSDPKLVRILVSPAVDLNLRSLMDEGRVLLVNLSKGQLGEDSSTILGSVLVSALGLSAFGRADMSARTRRPFFIYVDEFQSFTTRVFANMISEMRKTGVGLVLANQHLHQIEPDIRHAVLGNAGTLISFRVGAEDASMLAKEFQPKFSTLDMLNLPNHSIFLKLLIDGVPSQPFSAATLC